MGEEGSKEISSEEEFRAGTEALIKGRKILYPDGAKGRSIKDKAQALVAGLDDQTVSEMVPRTDKGKRPRRKVRPGGETGGQTPEKVFL
ncbi:MAG: hypothetical protein UY21_C0018G0015 [Microgenomates group bacterium GW2011_GWA1_48_10]|uniref:Uncharacterized protein n=1 Tax=Candidatus Gottesmanbacteria bacterium RIFCSPHIGHO2_01_FULL_47_48 TaxID=1798381 RepID=A0A1F6A3U6_9BACT|nr:MAG: hypothetical protein UY21_C0018G0015 [Microgenomates group bacterium GW2011_GWA1_48_10]OGG19380.1 MAG: hypothetical protein A2721_02530 [Candidatus Gottesmanbacteria bacterium RIFCSPHIGHO2_01_FULL_47_48]